MNIAIDFLRATANYLEKRKNNRELTDPYRWPEWTAARLKSHLERGNVDVHHKHDFALRRAAGRDETGNVITLLAAGADATARDSEALVNATEYYPICYTRGPMETVKALLVAGADPNAQKGAALMGAIRNSYVGTVEALLVAGATVTDKALNEAFGIINNFSYFGRDGENYARAKKIGNLLEEYSKPAVADNTKTLKEKLESVHEFVFQYPECNSGMHSDIGGRLDRDCRRWDVSGVVSYPGNNH